MYRLTQLLKILGELFAFPLQLLSTIVESLKNLHLIKQDQVEFIALPLKLKDGDGSPVRALAVV